MGEDVSLTVGVNVSAACGAALSGVGYHIICLLRSIDRLAPSDWKFPLFFECSNRTAVVRARQRLPVSDRMPLVPVPFPSIPLATVHRLLNKFWYPFFIRRQKCDVFHGPAHLVNQFLGIPTIVTIHDLAFFFHQLYQPEFTAALQESVLSSMQSAHVVIALSEATKRDVAQVARREKDVYVVYGAGNYANDGAQSQKPQDAEILQRMGIQGRYVFYVGDFGPRKNLPFLIHSFGHLLTRKGVDRKKFWNAVEGESERNGFHDIEPFPLQLVLAGNSSPDVKKALWDQAETLGMDRNAVILPGRVDDDELAVLYRNASVFALTSKAEGFGMIILEAMSYGVPVVAAYSSVILEVAGDAAELVPKDNALAFACSLYTVLTSSSKRECMIQRGYERVRQFSWDRTALETLALYQLARDGTGRVCDRAPALMMEPHSTMAEPAKG